jgi:hypothetical protein
MTRPNFIDWFIYRLFYWRWSKIWKERPDLYQFCLNYSDNNRPAEWKPRVLIEHSEDGIVTYDADPSVNVLLMDYDKHPDAELPDDWAKWLSAKYS